VYLKASSTPFTRYSIFCCNYSAAIHQDGEKPVLFVPYFFRELLGFLLNWRKQRPKGLKPFARFRAKAFESLIRKTIIWASIRIHHKDVQALF
jgi:hypothetical protein